MGSDIRGGKSMSVNKAMVREKISKKLRDAYREGRRSNAVYIELDGERVTLAEAARSRGLTLSCIYQRYRAGERGQRLLRPQEKRYRRPKTYHLNMTMREWEIVLDHAKRISIDAAANRYGVPYGAITAMLRGEWERVS